MFWFSNKVKISNLTYKKENFYTFFWVIPRRLNFICRRFGTLRVFHLRRWVGMKYTSYTFCSMINQLFTSAQHLLPLIIGLRVSTDHSVVFRSLICCKFQGAVHTLRIPTVFSLKLLGSQMCAQLPETCNILRT